MDYSEIQALRRQGFNTAEMAQAALLEREEGLALKIAKGIGFLSEARPPLPRGASFTRVVREHHLAWGGPSMGYDEGTITVEPVIGTTFGVVVAASDSIARYFPANECIIRLESQEKLWI